jgi:hypothetical protein
LFRHALLLHGAEGPARKRDVVAAAQRAFAIDPLPFQKLLDLREGSVKPRELEPVTLLASCLEAIGLVIDAVDRLEP